MNSWQDEERRQERDEMRWGIVSTMIALLCGLSSVISVAQATEQPKVLELVSPYLSDNKDKNERNSMEIATLRDPFEWAGKTPSIAPRRYKGASLKLQAILWSKRRPVAIINGKLLEEGDLIEDSMVMAIRPESVLLRRVDGSTKQLELEKNFLEVFGK